MSLLLHYNFNENDNSVVYDYSTNGKDATAINNFVVVAGELGFAGRFNGADTDLNFGNVGSVAGTDQLSIFCKFNKDADKVQYLAYKRDHYRLYLDGVGKLIFEVFIGGGWFGPTSDLTFNDSTWYNVLAVYDGAKIYIYVAGLEDVSAVKVGNIDASANDFIIGSDTASFFDGDIEQVEVWNTAHNADAALAHSNNPIGIKYTTLQDHNLLLGDLIASRLYNVASAPKGMVVTYKDDNDTYRAVPILGKIQFSETPVRRGNIYQTSRQWITEFVIENDEPIIQFYDNITSFILSSPALKITKSGILLPPGTLSSFPLKFTSGAVLVPAVVGAMEFLNDDLYFSISTSKSNVGQYPPAHTTVYVKATSEFGGSRNSYNATNPALSLIGSSGGTVWRTADPNNTNQRFHIDLGSAKTITNVMYHNYHSSGGSTTLGAKNFTMWGSNSASDFADLVYGNDGTWTELPTGVSQLDIHVSSNVPDEKEFSVTNSIAYRYYAFKFANNWGHPNAMGLRHIELQTGTDFRKGVILNDGDDLVSGRIPFASTNGRLIDSDDLQFDGDALTLKKDLLFVGSGSGVPFGECHQEDGLTFDVTMTTQNVWVEVDAATTNISATELNLVTFPDDHSLLCLKAGRYLVTYSMTGEVNSVAGGDQHIESSIMVNGVVQVDKGMGHEQYAATGKEKNLQGHTIINVPENGSISLALKNTSSSGKTLTIDHLNITVSMLGGV